MPALKKCYYEVLGIERNATEDDIKKSFRKLALQMHPDKNLDRLEEAKSEFQLLQQAYEVLSNPQERAWYDEHRHAVLRGGLNEDFEDDSIDLMPYCMSSCYSGFGDDEKGFYTVYRNLFEKIAAEEHEAGLDEDEDETPPSFGDSGCSYDDVVGPFYAYWESFCTRKLFAWLDEYDTRQAGCRRVSRLMGKENKKLRLEAKRDWNQRVRALVDFAKRKDKRVHAWKAEQEIKLREKEAALAQKFADDKAKRIQERKKLLEAVRKENGRKSSGSENQNQIKEIENWMANEFGDQEEASDDEEDAYHCDVCNKIFRTVNSFTSHERSKKHIALLQSRVSTTEENEASGDGDEPLSTEEIFEDENDVPEIETVASASMNDTKAIGVASESTIQSPSRLIENDSSNLESEDEDDKLLKINNFKKSAKYHLSLEAEEEAEDIVELVSVMSTNEDSERKETEVAETAKLKKKRRANKATKQTASEASTSAAGSDDVLPNASKITSCAVCKENFKSRTALFEHLKKTKHAVPFDNKTSSKNSHDFSEPDRGKKGKGKGKKR